MVLDALAKASNIAFVDSRYGFVAQLRHKGRTFVLLKPSTYMNLSGKAVSYWLQKESIALDNLLVVVDDIALPLGAIRLRPRGSDGGHNGLKNINEVLGTQDYARLRFGIGNGFSRGRQVDYVLGEWTDDELKALPDKIAFAGEAVLAFGTVGLERAMNLYNNR